MIRVEHLRVDLGDRTVIQDVSLAVARGGWLAIAGPNGTGKSTLLRALAGSQRATGTVTLGGRAVGALPRRDRARTVAIAPQAPLIPPGTSVLDYVLLGRTPHLGPFGAEGAADRAVAADAVSALELDALRHRAVDTLSGGERQRAVLARALAQEAPVLLLDEPTSALDLGHQQHVLEAVDRLRAERGLTVVSTTHDLTLVSQYADRLALLDEGRVLAEGPPGEVLTEPNLSRCYRAPVRVVDAGGFVAVVPHRGAHHAHRP